MSRLKLFLPLIIFVILALFFWMVLRNEGYDPQDLPSALLDKPVPGFSLENLENDKVLTQESLKGEKFLLNVWATWCISCRVEHPYLNQLSMEGVKIVGLNYKDNRPGALEWLAELGNPYAMNIFDEEGKLGLDLGVYGAPETYIVDATGMIRHKHIGVINGKVWQEKIRPIYDSLD